MLDLLHWRYMSDLAEFIGFSPTGNEETLGSNAKRSNGRWGCEFRYVDGNIVRVYNFGRPETTDNATEISKSTTENKRGKSLAGRPSYAPLRRRKPQPA